MSRLSDDPEKRAKSLANLQKGRQPGVKRPRSTPVSRETVEPKKAKVGSYEDPPAKPKGKPRVAKKPPAKTSKKGDGIATPSPAGGGAAPERPAKRGALGSLWDGIREGLS